MAVTASEARQRLFPLIEQVNDDAEPVEILSRRGNAYLVGEAQWRSMQETVFLLSSPANAARLLEGVEQARRGQAEPRELDREP